MRNLFLGILLLGVATTASAQWSDNFDGYAVGTSLSGVGGWFGWDANPAWAGTVSAAQANTAPHSIAISGATDAVHPFAAGTYAAGRWTISARQFIPAASFTADTYFIVNNVYNHGGPYSWTIELQFDKATNRVLDDFRAEPVVPILFDAWVEIRIVADLTNNTQCTWYGGSLVSTGTWTTPFSGPTMEIQNIDLFTTGGTCYYDDVSVAPIAWTAIFDQPVGAAMLRIRNYGGTPLNWYLNAVSTVLGSTPFGWLYGLDISMIDLAIEVTFGDPFFGPLGPCGERTQIVAGPIGSGIALYIVSIELAGGLPVQATAPFVYVTM